jgi:hypothetical protein
VQRGLLGFSQALVCGCVALLDRDLLLRGFTGLSSPDGLRKLIAHHDGVFDAKLDFVLQALQPRLAFLDVAAETVNERLLVMILVLGAGCSP